MANNVESLKSGDVLFVQGETPSEMYMLNSGTLEILSTSDEFNGLDRDIIISKSTRVGLIKGKSLVSGLSRLYTAPYVKSVRAVEDSSVTRYPLRNGGFKGIIVSDVSQALTVLRQLYSSLNTAMSNLSRYAKLYQTLSIMNDNMAIMYIAMSETNASDDLHTRAESINTKYKANSGPEPETYDTRFLITDNGRFLKKRYELPDGNLYTTVDKKTSDLIMRFLKLDQNVFKSIIKADPVIGMNMFEILTDNYINLLNRIERIQEFIDNELKVLFGDDNSWTYYLADSGGLNEWTNSGKLSRDFLKNFQSLINKINVMYNELTGSGLVHSYPALKKFNELYTEEKVEPEPKKEGRKAAAPAVVSGGSLSRSMNQIFEFSMIDKDFQSRFIKLMTDFKDMKNPFNTDSEGRKLRRHITKMYWDLYKQTFVRSLSESAVPKPVQLMIQFGYLDEELMEEEQLNDLNELIRMKEKTGKVPVLKEKEFLKLIYEGKIEPSITEMGLNFEGYLKEQEKHRSKKEKDSSKGYDENTQKVLYEIEQRLASTAAVCSGSTATAFPILTSNVIKGSLKQFYVHKRKLEHITNEIRGIDFSLFYREVVLKLGDAREIIQEEVVPYFILLPIFGTKTLLWQDLTGTNKRSRGRIVVPIFFMGDLRKSMLHTFACFRWELNRTVRGAMWADPIEGGITGEYFDYVNTYKKMSKLSQEAKEKISERFKALRTNRDRFADDYIQWLMYEKDGIMKQNSVVREMFFKHIPFVKEIREKLENMPAFTQSATRYKNIHKREVDGYERRFKKYMDSEGNHPPEIQKYFEFLAK